MKYLWVEVFNIRYRLYVNMKVNTLIILFFEQKTLDFKHFSAVFVTFHVYNFSYYNLLETTKTQQSVSYSDTVFMTTGLRLGIK